MLKKRLKLLRLMCSNIFDHVTDFEVCAFIKITKKLNILRAKHFFFKKRIH